MSQPQASQGASLLGDRRAHLHPLGTSLAILPWPAALLGPTTLGMESALQGWLHQHSAPPGSLAAGTAGHQTVILKFHVEVGTGRRVLALKSCHGSNPNVVILLKMAENPTGLDSPPCFLGAVSPRLPASSAACCSEQLALSPGLGPRPPPCALSQPGPLGAHCLGAGLSPHCQGSSGKAGSWVTGTGGRITALGARGLEVCGPIRASGRGEHGRGWGVGKASTGP